MKVMMTRMSLVALVAVVHLASAVVSVAAPDSPECLGEAPPGHCAGSSKGAGADDDWFSLLQVSVTAPESIPSKQSKHPLPDGLSDNSNSQGDLALRQTELKLKITEARASLAAMEEELAQMGGSSSTIHSGRSEAGSTELSADSSKSAVATMESSSNRGLEHHSKKGQPEDRSGFMDISRAVVSDGSLEKFVSRRCPQARRPTTQRIKKTEGEDDLQMALVQTKDGTIEDATEKYPMRDDRGPGAGGGGGFEPMEMSWRGMSHFQVPTIESHVSGHRCQSLPSVHNVGGPAALPNILANTIVLYQEAGYEGSKLRDMVSNALSTQLSAGGPWNVVSGIFDWNLYHEATKFCTVAVKFQLDEPDWYSDWIAFGA